MLCSVYTIYRQKTRSDEKIFISFVEKVPGILHEAWLAEYTEELQVFPVFGWGYPHVFFEAMAEAIEI